MKGLALSSEGRLFLLTVKISKKTKVKAEIVSCYFQPLASGPVKIGHILHIVLDVSTCGDDTKCIILTASTFGVFRAVTRTPG